MKARIAASGIVLAAAATALTRCASHAPSSPSVARAYILQSERDWIATNPQEVAVVKRIVADDIVWINDGKIYDKAGVLRDAAAGPGDVVAERVDSLNVRFFGDTAVVRGTNTAVHKSGRKTHGVFVDTWVLRDRLWQIVASADEPVPLKT